MNTLIIGVFNWNIEFFLSLWYFSGEENQENKNNRFVFFFRGKQNKTVIVICNRGKWLWVAGSEWMNHAYLLWWNSLKSIRFKDYYWQPPRNYALWYSENYELDNIFAAKKKRKHSTIYLSIYAHLSTCYCHFISTIGSLASFCDANHTNTPFGSVR